MTSRRTGRNPSKPSSTFALFRLTRSLERGATAGNIIPFTSLSLSLSLRIPSHRTIKAIEVLALA
ncbi:hypothetical protein BT93_L2938 [Corymbia citriodora subsp. variegata]|uniref:Uncharacterized protein n=1 Tax=Corymbia citriodora subsp. variegata TaxID=360336 RepID=A0A8T0CNQ4_CORYI|nr:hypothetical protein BT93_L2938 [Corymbia citriodora subsp. variegata]